MKIAILGFGVVGSGAYDIISGYDCGLEVKKVLVRSPKERLGSAAVTDFEEIVRDPEIELVMEAIGGLHPAYEYAVGAIEAGKHFVSANKQLISHYYEELVSLANRKGVRICFAPSSGGGIPWLPNLLRAARCDRIERISGILNGTTNYILYNMAQHGLGFDEVLSDAQAKGYAEADPTSDIDGIDAQRKCCISASLAFDVSLAEDSVQVFGIRRIRAEDIAAAKAMGRVCKLMIAAGRDRDGVFAYVEPTLLPASAPESLVANADNMVTLVGKEIGRLSFMGQGAGKEPTGSSMVQDALDIARGDGVRLVPGAPAAADNSGEKHRYYVRTTAPRELLEGLGAEFEDGYCITGEVSVAGMHEAAKAVLAADPLAFFAGIV